MLRPHALSSVAVQKLLLIPPLHNSLQARASWLSNAFNDIYSIYSHAPCDACMSAEQQRF